MKYNHTLIKNNPQRNENFNYKFQNITAELICLSWPVAFACTPFLIANPRTVKLKRLNI